MDEWMDENEWIKNIKYLLYYFIECSRCLPRAYLDYRKSHGPCRNSRSIGRENINCWPAIRKMFSVYPHRQSDKFPWLRSAFDRRLASHDESPIFFAVNGWAASAPSAAATDTWHAVWKIRVKNKWEKMSINQNPDQIFLPFGKL